MNIQLAHTDAEIQACYPVLRELRPHLVEAEFVTRIRRQASAGYRLVCAMKSTPVAVAGFRVSENLAWGRFLYVDDWITLPQHRSQGIGGQMFVWLKAHGIQQGCTQLHLDSGLQRLDAHRFYLREWIEKTGFHFAAQLNPETD